MSDNNGLPKFYKCNTCGNIIEMVCDSSMIPVCCGQEMEELIAHKNDMGQEKHVPVFEIDGKRVIVDIGSTPHPMTAEHHIAWVELVTDKGIYRKHTASMLKPHLHFLIDPNETVLAIYEYCNIHGLWANIR